MAEGKICCWKVAHPVRWFKMDYVFLGSLCTNASILICLPDHGRLDFGLINYRCTVTPHGDVPNTITYNLMWLAISLAVWVICNLHSSGCCQ